MKYNGQYSNYFRESNKKIVGKIAIVNVGWNKNDPTIGGGGINGLFKSVKNLSDVNNTINTHIDKDKWNISDCYICEWNNKETIKKFRDIMLYIRGPVGSSSNFDDEIDKLCQKIKLLIFEYNKNKKKKIK